MFHEMTIAGLKRQLPLCKVTDDLYIGAFIMFGDVEITVASARELLKKAPEFDIDQPYSDVYVEDFLYDLDADPHERHNLVIDPAYAQVRAELKEILIGYMKKAQEPDAVILPMKPEDFHE